MDEYQTLKKNYKDENELIEKYCARTQCKHCFGSDDTGELNGYGCESMEQWVDDNYHLIK